MRGRHLATAVIAAINRNYWLGESGSGSLSPKGGFHAKLREEFELCRLPRRIVSAALLSLLPCLAVTHPLEAQTRTRLSVYTALDNDQLAPFKAAAEADIPDIDISWVREGTGVITAR